MQAAEVDVRGCIGQGCTFMALKGISGGRRQRVAGLQAERGVYCRPYPFAPQSGHGCVLMNIGFDMCLWVHSGDGPGCTFASAPQIGWKASLAIGPACCNFQYSEAVCGVWARCGLSGRAASKVCMQAPTATKLIAHHHYSTWLSAAVT